MKIGVALLLICIVTASIYPSERALNISGIGPANQLPLFVSSLPHGPVFGVLDSCPDDIWQNLLCYDVPHLPYVMLDSYDRKQTPAKLPVLIVENQNYIATVEPQFGGKIASLYHKPSKR